MGKRYAGKRNPREPNLICNHICKTHGEGFAICVLGNKTDGEELITCLQGNKTHGGQTIFANTFVAKSKEGLQTCFYMGVTARVIYTNVFA